MRTWIGFRWIVIGTANNMDHNHNKGNHNHSQDIEDTIRRRSMDIVRNILFDDGRRMESQHQRQ